MAARSLLFLLVCAWAAAGRAEVVLDQSSLGTARGSSQPGPTSMVAQTFTAGVSGELARIRVYLMREDAVSADAKLSVFPVVTGTALLSQGSSVVIPNSAIPIFTGFASAATVDNMLEVDVSGLDFQLSAGTQYGFGLTSGDPVGPPILHLFSGSIDPDGPYAGGSVQFSDGTRDFALRNLSPTFDLLFATFVDTFVAVPEPGADLLLLLGIALAGLGFGRRGPEAA